jgi:hypothetical protein
MDEQHTARIVAQNSPSGLARFGQRHLLKIFDFFAGFAATERQRLRCATIKK